MKTLSWIILAASSLPFLSPLAAGDPQPLVLADFESADFGAWQAAGTAFGSGPARGTLPRQMRVEGFLGSGFVNSFHGGDGAQGTLTSPPFRIERKYLTFLIGGGGWPDETCVNLLVDGKVVRTATGTNTAPGGSERLTPLAWDLSEFEGREAVITVVDKRAGGWGHINLDHLVQTSDRGGIALAAPPVPLLPNVARELAIAKPLLHFPVKNGARKRTITISHAGAEVRQFSIELADELPPDWWAPLDVRAWSGQTLRIAVDALPEGSQAMDSLRQADTLLDAGDLYREPLRPQWQFSAKRGWNNDPNGLVFFHGEYHLFFQHNPYGWGWGNMHWGHATSRDLVHWEEHGEALYPDEMGPMFSGSAVVDWKNTSGLGKDGKPPLVLFYTAAGTPAVQCMAYSLDGRTFTKYAGNPIIREITPGNRDPKVIWHDPSQQWVLTLYVGLPKPNPAPDAKDRPAVEHTIHFFTSPNLKEWTLRSQTPGLYECPDFFELPLDDDPARKKWVLTAASSEYFLGSFDGQTFTPETPKLKGHRGRGFYAAQTYSDTPDGRRIQVGWGQAPSPGMPFNQLLTFPCELKLRQTPDGPRLTWTPVAELAKLQGPPQNFGPAGLDASSPNPLSGIDGELLQVELDLQPGAGSETVLTVRGLEISYDAAKQELSTGDLTAPAPLQQGRLRLVVLTDRTFSTLFASEGLTYMPLPHIAAAQNRGVTLRMRKGTATLMSARSMELRSIWPGPVP